MYIKYSKSSTGPICSGSLSNKGGPVTGSLVFVWFAKHVHFLKPVLATGYGDGLEAVVQGDGLGLLRMGTFAHVMTRIRLRSLSTASENDIKGARKK